MRRQLPIAVVSLALLGLGACASEAGTSEEGSLPECSNVFGPAPSSIAQVTVGATHDQYFYGGNNQCEVIDECGYYLFPFLTCKYHWEPCPPWITLVRGPEGAEGGLGHVTWRATPETEGTRVEFEATAGAAGCLKSFTWSVEVLPGPKILGFEVPRDVRPGVVSMVAVFERGVARLELASGASVATVPATLKSGEPFSATFDSPGNYQLVLTVTDDFGVEVEASGSLRVWDGPPTIAHFVADHPCVQAGSEDTLRYAVSGAAEVTVGPAGQPAPATNGYMRVRPLETTTYVLIASNPAWEPVSRELTVRASPPVRIASMAATPSELPLGGQATLTVDFDACEATVYAGSLTASITSGQPLLLPPQQGTVRYHLILHSLPGGGYLETDLVVPVVGPGTFAPLPVVGANAPIAAGTFARLDGALALLVGHDSAQVVDLATGEYQPPFALGGTGPDARALRLPDGRVLVAGIHGYSPFEQPAVRIIDPEARSATVLHVGHVPSDAAVLPLPDGRAAVLYDQQLVLFDPATGAVAYLPVEGGRAGPAGCVLADGRIFGVGWNSWELIDRETLGVAGAGATLGAPGGRDAACLVDGSAIFATTGGYEETATDLERFDPVAGTTSIVARLETPPRRLVALQDGRVLLLGDRGAYLLDPVAGTIERRGLYALPDALRFTAVGTDALLLDDGRVAVLRGSRIELFTP